MVPLVNWTWKSGATLPTFVPFSAFVDVALTEGELLELTTSVDELFDVLNVDELVEVLLADEMFEVPRVRYSDAETAMTKTIATPAT